MIFIFYSGHERIICSRTRRVSRPNGPAGTTRTHRDRTSASSEGHGPQERAGDLAGLEVDPDRTETQSGCQECRTAQSSGHQEVFKVQQSRQKGKNEITKVHFITNIKNCTKSRFKEKYPQIQRDFPSKFLFFIFFIRYQKIL